MSKLGVWKEAEIYRNDSAGVQVFRGLLLGSNTPVAVKELTFPTLQQANQGLQEALSAVRLAHPGILQTLDCSMDVTAEGLYKTVLVSELMTEDLFKTLNRKHQEQTYWAEGELMGMLGQVVAALSYAERMGVCHRDIKPQNLFTNENQSVVKVGDFGIAARGSLFGERKSTLVGSPFFLSPELKRSFSKLHSGAQGAASTYDPFKSDVYSLGVTFLYLTTLVPPVVLMDLENLPVKTEEVLGTVAGYAVLQWYLRWMLAPDEQSRPYFHQIEENLMQYGYILSNSPQYQSSAEPVWYQEVAPEPVWYQEVAPEPLEQPQPAYCYANQGEEVKAPVVSQTCLGCPASLKRFSTARVELPCGHKFHDVNCFFAHLERKNEDFKGQYVNISCPLCPSLDVSDKKGLLAKAFDGFEKFTKRREASRKRHCTVCHSPNPSQYRQDCGHRYCSTHPPPSKDCKFCLPEWRDV